MRLSRHVNPSNQPMANKHSPKENLPAQMCLKDCHLFVMYTDPDEFDVRLWLADLNVSEAGMKTVAKNDITDHECLIHQSATDINHLRLTVGDKSRILRGIDVLREPKETSGSQSTAESQGATPVVTADQTKTQVGGEKITYTVEEVAKFLAGDRVPTNVQASIAVQGSTLQQPQQQQSPSQSANVPYPQYAGLYSPFQCIYLHVWTF